MFQAFKEMIGSTRRASFDLNIQKQDILWKIDKQSKDICFIESNKDKDNFYINHISSLLKPKFSNKLAQRLSELRIICRYWTFESLQEIQKELLKDLSTDGLFSQLITLWAYYIIKRMKQTQFNQKEEYPFWLRQFLFNQIDLFLTFLINILTSIYYRGFEKYAKKHKTKIITSQLERKIRQKLSEHADIHILYKQCLQKNVHWLDKYDQINLASDFRYVEKKLNVKIHNQIFIKSLKKLNQFYMIKPIKQKMLKFKQLAQQIKRQIIQYSSDENLTIQADLNIKILIFLIWKSQLKFQGICLYIQLIICQQIKDPSRYQEINQQMQKYLNTTEEIALYKHLVGLSTKKFENIQYQ